MQWLAVYSAAFLGNLAAWWWVFKRWKFPKIVYVPVDRDNEMLKHVQRSLELKSDLMKRKGRKNV